MIEHRLLRSEGERRYLLWPADTRPGPTLLFLAGTGGTADWAADESRLPEIAPREGFHLVVPEAQRPRPDEPARFIHNPPRWNDGSPAPTPELQTDVDDVGFLAAVISDLIQNGVADPARVCLAGFSNGAGMAFRFAAERSELLAAVAPIAGLWWPNARPTRPVPTLFCLGSADPLIPFRGGEVHLPWGNRLVRRPPAIQTLERWADAIGCSTHSILESDNGSVRDEVFPGPVEFRALFVEGLGHHWPGGKGQLNPRIAGPINDRLDLNPRLLAFCRRHPRPQ